MVKMSDRSDFELLQIALSDPSKRVKVVRVLGEGENAALDTRSRELLRRLALDFMNEDVSGLVSGNPGKELESTMSHIVGSNDVSVQVRGLLNAGLWKGYEGVAHSLKAAEVKGHWGAFLRGLSLYRVTEDDSFLEDASKFLLAAERDGRPIHAAADEILQCDERVRLNRLLGLAGCDAIGRRVSVQQSAASILAAIRWRKGREEEK